MYKLLRYFTKDFNQDTNNTKTSGYVLTVKCNNLTNP